MGENTKIEWATHTWNPWKRVTWGAGEDRKKTSPGTWAAPRELDRAAAAAGRIDTVFCLSLGDIWDNEVDPLWRHQAFEVMNKTPSLVYLLLSKRIGNSVKMCDPLAGNPLLPRNAALGSTLINQEEWDRDFPKPREAARVLEPGFIFVSSEPLLGLINMGVDLPDWVIVGGESGRHARPMHPEWARSIRDQCATAKVPFLFKQWGEHVDVENMPDETWRSLDCNADQRCHATGPVYVGKKAAGRLLDGREHNDMPRVYEAVAAAA